MKINSMKTIEKAALNCNKEYSLQPAPAYLGFIQGVKFAQQFYLIERNQYAEIDLNQKEELESNMPILVKYLNEYNETTYDVFAEYYPSLEDPIYTHWRPINYE